MFFCRWRISFDEFFRIVTAEGIDKSYDTHVERRYGIDSFVRDFRRGEGMYSNSSAQSVLRDYSATENWEPPPPVSFFTRNIGKKEIAPSMGPGPGAEQELRYFMHCVADHTDNAEQAFTTLYTHYEKRIFRFCLFHLRNAATAQELMHDVFLIVWQSAHTYQGQSSLEVWLFGIAHNLCRNARRRAMGSVGIRPERETVRARERPASEEPSVPITIDASSPDLNPEGQTAAHQRCSLVQRLINRLSLVQQEVLHFTYVEGLSIHDIAQILGVASGTVKSRMFTARCVLRHYMQEAGLTREDL
jgi:RNA polymerase sigma-70 factor (ECF subfamily)